MDLNQWMNAIRPQAGMDGGGGGDASGKSVSADNEGIKVNSVAPYVRRYEENDVYRNNADGSTTRVVSKTAPELWTEIKTQREATVHLSIREYYATSAGPASRDFANKREHKDNAQPLLDWYRGGTWQIKALRELSGKSFSSAKGFAGAVDKIVRPQFTTVRDRAQMAADVAGTHHPRYPDGTLIPYDK
jgi:hypothetical protein